MVLAGAGGVEHEQLVEYAQRYFGQLDSGLNSRFRSFLSESGLSAGPAIEPCTFSSAEVRA